MIEYIKTCTDWSPTVSVELEKTRLGLVALLPQADVVCGTVTLLEISRNVM